MAALSLILLTLVLAAGLTVVVLVINGRIAASTAADAAALAAAPATFSPLGLGSPEEVAGRFAAENGAVLISCSCGSDPTWASRSVVVEVAVEVSLPFLGPTPVRAVSRAEFAPVALTAPRGWVSGRGVRGASATP